MALVGEALLGGDPCKRRVGSGQSRSRRIQPQPAHVRADRDAVVTAKDPSEMRGIDARALGQLAEAGKLRRRLVQSLDHAREPGRTSGRDPSRNRPQRRCDELESQSLHSDRRGGVRSGQLGRDPAGQRRETRVATSSNSTAEALDTGSSAVD